MAEYRHTPEPSPPKECPSSLDYNTQMKNILLNDHLKDFLKFDGLSDQTKSSFPYIKQITDFTAVLPSLNRVRLVVRNAVLKSIVELEVQDILTKSETLNWWDNSELLILKTTSDGNCLAHAAALYIWGTEDSQLQLRKYMYAILKHEIFGTLIKRYWQFEKDQETYQLTPEQLDEEWAQVIEGCSCENKSSDQQGLPYQMLEAIHIFTLSNILARPIIVLSNRNVYNLNGEALQNDTLGGIYLPFLVDPAEVYKSPIMLVYYSNHFMPLISQMPTRSKLSPNFQVPLVRKKLDPLKIHFSLPDQKKDEFGCLKNFLWVKEELQEDDADYCNKYLVAEIKIIKIDESVDLMLDFVTAVRNWHTTHSPPESSESSSVNKRCQTVGCSYYCTVDNEKFCSQCLKKFKTTDVEGASNSSAVSDYENITKTQGEGMGTESRINQTVLQRHLADLDDYLEPLVTHPAGSQSEKAQLPSTGTTSSVVSKKPDLGMGRSEISSPRNALEHSEQNLDVTGISQMAAQVRIADVPSQRSQSPVYQQRLPSYDIPSTTKIQQEAYSSSIISDARGAAGTTLSHEKHNFRDHDSEEHLSLRTESKFTRPSDLVRGAPPSTFPEYKTERSFQAELCKYPGCDKFGDENLKKFCVTHYRKIVNRMQMEKHLGSKHSASSYAYSQRPLDYGSSSAAVEDYSKYELPTSPYSRSGMTSEYTSSRVPDEHSSQGIFTITSTRSQDISKYDRYVTRDRQSPLEPVTRVPAVEAQPAIDRLTSPQRSDLSNLPPSSSLLEASPDELRSLADVEAKIKQDAKYCKADGCNNYGNSRKIGYCNACFDKLYKNPTAMNY